MSRLPHRRLTLVALVALSLTLAGCSALGGDDPLPDGEEAVAQFTSLDGYTATVNTTVRTADGTTTFVQRIAASPADNRFRVDFEAPPSRAGDVVVVNESAFVRYNATSGQFIRAQSRGSDPLALARQQIRLLVDRAGDGGTVATAPSVNVSPLPVVPGGETGEREDTARLRVSYDGTDTVLGRETYRLRLTPVNETTAGVQNQTVWLDAEWFLPVRSRTVVGTGPDRQVVVARPTALDYEPGLSAAAFRFDPPPDARQSTERIEATTFENRSALVAATDLAVPDPTVPDSYRLFRSQLATSNGSRVLSLEYTDGSSVLAVVKSELDRVALRGDPVEVDGTTGYRKRSRAANALVWECGGFEYFVRGTTDNATITSVARSVGC